MKKTFGLIMACLLSVVLPCTLSSCSNDDGDWEEMIWKTSVKTVKDGTIHVESSGGTFTFKCKNYDPWLCSISQFEDGQEGEVFLPVDTSSNLYADQNLYIAGTWLSARFTGSTLTVEIKPNDSQKQHKMIVEVTAGDIFDRFVFLQDGLSDSGK